jgi:hypothetical protein
MKIAILSSCLEPAKQDWLTFYQSAERYLMPSVEKHYFLFANGGKLLQNLPNVTVVPLAALHENYVPGSTFQYYLAAGSQLENFDYLYAFDANCRLTREIGTDFLPDESDQLVAVQDAGQVNIPVNRVPYERNPKSNAFIRTGLGQCYVSGKIVGGSTAAFLLLLRSVYSNMLDDYHHGLAAFRSEESYLNRHLLDHAYSLRHAGYCYPSAWKLGLPMMIQWRPTAETHPNQNRRSWPGKSRPKDRVTVALAGDLGQQLFQYSMGRSLSQRLGCPLELDTRSFDCQCEQEYGLGNFNIRIPIAANRYRSCGWLGWLGRGKLQNLLAGQRVVQQSQAQFDPSILNYRGNILPKGYWQSERYFSSIADTLRSDLRPTAKLSTRSMAMLELINGQSSLAVHYPSQQSSGEVLKMPSSSDLPTSYYRRAVERIAARTRNQPTIFLFSQDVHRAASELATDCPVVMVRESDFRSQYEWMLLMAACEHQVISRETTAWWAAWLNRNPEKIVVAPKDESPESACSIHPQAAAHWIQLDYSTRATTMLRAA